METRWEDPSLVLKALANDHNRRLFEAVADEASHGRALAAKLGLHEAEVSRRLRILERAGLLESRWVRNGHNVKQYRARPVDIVLRMRPDGLVLTTGRDCRFEAYS